MENEKANGHDVEGIEPDSVEEKGSNQTPAYSLEDLASEEDDLSITGDNVLSHVIVRRPHKQEWFQCHPTWRLSTRAVIDSRNGADVVYLLNKKLMPWSKSLEQDSVPVLVRPCVNNRGRIFLWVIKKSKDDGDPSGIYKKALDHIEEATRNWIRRFWVDEERTHHRRIAQISDKPAWPDGVTFQDIVIAGFGPRIIMSEDAPILKELRGENV
jgi:hypothetical protein